MLFWLLKNNLLNHYNAPWVMVAWFWLWLICRCIFYKDYTANGNARAGFGKIIARDDIKSSDISSGEIPRRIRTAFLVAIGFCFQGLLIYGSGMNISEHNTETIISSNNDYVLSDIVAFIGYLLCYICVILGSIWAAQISPYFHKIELIAFAVKKCSQSEKYKFKLTEN
jgi:hypothetical protein